MVNIEPVSEKRCVDPDNLLTGQFAPLPSKLYGTVLKFLNSLHLSKWKARGKDEYKQSLFSSSKKVIKCI